MLDGLTIIEVARSAPVRAATTLLVELGATITVVDATSTPDPAVDDGKSHQYIDLKSANGRRSFLELVSASDGLMEGMRPGVFDRLGLKHRMLVAANPRLVRVSVSGYGQEGPYASLPAYDLVLQGLGGMLQASGTATPAMPSSVWADRTGALSAAIAMLTGLLAALRTGQGYWFDTALLDQVICGRPESDPMLRGDYPCYNVYSCADGQHVALALRAPHFWARFCNSIGRPGWESEHLPSPDRASTITTELRHIIASRTQAEWVSMFREWDLPAGPVHLPDALEHDPHLAARYAFGASGLRLFPPRLVSVQGTAPDP